MGSTQQEGISIDAVRVLIFANLIMINDADGGGHTTPSITQAGFQFLLMDTPSQVWFFILQYLNKLEEMGNGNLHFSDCLNFLFQLSFAELGKVRII